jgi:hypothetical protein
MNLPLAINSEVLAEHASPHDTRKIRVVLRRVANTGMYRLRGRKREYHMVFDPSLSAHILDVPESLWMDGIPQGSYAENLSIAHDIQGNRSATLAPLVFLLLPYGDGSAASAPHLAATEKPQRFSAAGLSILGEIEGMLRKLDAPPEAIECLNIARFPHEDETVLQVLREFIGGMDVTEAEAPPAEEPEAAEKPAENINPRTGKPYTPDALRMRLKRQREAATA